MNRLSRRGFLKLRPTPAAAPTVALPVLTGIAPYNGPWTKQEASHLLARATMGFRYDELTEAADLGLDATLDRLLEDLPLPAAPLTTSRLDGGAAVGETWVDKPYASGDGLMRSVVVRIRSLFSWIGRQIYTERMSARQTMLLFWHNHFAINTATDPKFNYRYLQTLYTHVYGDFRQLVKDITIDPLMLAFLNGSQNTRRAPNENYARELLELFTVGKGPQVGDGDYTNYTEQDVAAMAKSLTGWRNYGFNDTTTGDFGSRFVPNRHDPATVTLSHRFDNAQLPSSGENTYANLVDLILTKDEVARYIVRKLYRWFVYYDITPAVEAEVIEPLATLFRDGDYQIKPVLRALLGSEHFFDVLSQGPMIKHPLDFTTGLLKSFGVSVMPNARGVDSFYTFVSGAGQNLGMTYFTPPNVAGWKAFYQEPLYYRLWINSATLPLRQRYAQGLLAGQAEIPGFGNVEPDLVSVVSQFPEPAQLYPMLDEWILLLFPRPVPDAQREFLKEQLLPGLPDTQWTVEWANYLANPNDDSLRQALENKLRRMVRSMTEMPEFQLS